MTFFHSYVCIGIFVITVNAIGHSLSLHDSVVTSNNRSLCPETSENRPLNRVNTTSRLGDLRQMMSSREPVDAYLVTMSDQHGSASLEHEARLKFISGFSGSNGWAVVTENQAALWTDGRYFLQADNQMDCNWILMKYGESGYPKTTEWLKQVLRPGQRLGAHLSYVSISTWQQFEKDLAPRNITLVGIERDFVDSMWPEQDRPPRPNKPLLVHTVEFAGRTWQDKMADVRQQMVPGSALVVTSLEQVAWLFNLRGTDREESLFDAYAIVFRDSSSLYLRNYTKLVEPEAVRQHLMISANGSCTLPNSSSCINVYEYGAITEDLRRHSATYKLWIDPTANYAIYEAAGAERIVSRSPIELMKAIKNDVERRRFTECIRRDSAAVVEFAAFLENEIKAGRRWTELSASAELRKYREAYEHYRGDGFATISAFGSNGAIIHYRAVADTDRVIDQSSLYLLDSGGQYLDGTTDVTRTFHYGKPTDKMMDAYTRVLIGQIDLATTVWPEGLYGSDIDVRARAVLWQRGWDYNHGTGHGIGYFLSVHEGPGRININREHRDKYTPLYEGMFFSDEPGYYEDGEFGVRLESLVTIVEANTTYHFGNKKYLTFKTLTLIPYETNLIDYELLSPTHRSWLNAYNKRCLDEVGSMLKSAGKMEAYRWLLARTKSPKLEPVTSIGHRAAFPTQLVCVFLTAVTHVLAIFAAR